MIMQYWTNLFNVHSYLKCKFPHLKKTLNIVCGNRSPTDALNY